MKSQVNNDELEHIHIDLLIKQVFKYSEMIDGELVISDEGRAHIHSMQYGELQYLHEFMKWLQDCKLDKIAHSIKARQFEIWDKITYLVYVSTPFLIALEEIYTTFDVLLSTLLAIVAFLALGLKTFGLGKRESRHRTAASRYNGIIIQIQKIIIASNQERGDMKLHMETVGNLVQGVIEDAPILSRRVKEQAKKMS